MDSVVVDEHGRKEILEVEDGEPPNEIKKLESRAVDGHGVQLDGQLEDENSGACDCKKDHAFLEVQGSHLEEHKKEHDGEIKDNEGNDEDLGAEAPPKPEDDSASDSNENFLDESDSDQPSTLDDDEATIEATLTEAEIEELVAEFLEVESKAAEAQESLEKESLARVESEVRLELSECLQGDALDLAVSMEMDTFKKKWETELDDLETQGAILLEQLDGAGIELPSLYKRIESEVPNVCQTEAWKRRAHWVGSQVTSEVDQSIRNAEEYLQSCRPLRRKHGRLLEEGASGFLSEKLPGKDDSSSVNHEQSWSSFNRLIQSRKCPESTSFGSVIWASVYLASTPQEASALGLKLPGVDEVEEIGEIESNEADDLKNLDEIELSVEQKRKYKKVREEDDAKVTKKLQNRLKQRRKRVKQKEKISHSDSVLLSNRCSEQLFEKPTSSENGIASVDSDNNVVRKHYKDVASKQDDNENRHSTCPLKRALEEEDAEHEHKKYRTVIIDSDVEMQTEDGSHSLPSFEKNVNIIDLDAFSSPIPTKSESDQQKTFKCTICSEILKASDVHRHPVLEVIICGYCRFLLIEKTRLEDSVSGRYCTWCVKSEELISCNSCKQLLCTNCIVKNFGEACLSEAEATGWQCCCCLPSLLEHLIPECENAPSHPEFSNSESDVEVLVNESTAAIGKKRKNKRIRRILDDAELTEDTKNKIAMEKARQERLKSMHEQSASKLGIKKFGLSSVILSQVALEDGDGYIVNLAREEDEAPVRIPSSISVKLKSHQVAGIRFMWENVIQSVKRVRSGDEGLGCILAHNMGLGKTFQVIAFLYTVMRSVELGLRTAIVVTPVNVLHNWRKEFAKWRPTELKTLRVYMLDDVARVKRVHLLKKWQDKGGVLLIGYASFRNLSLGRHIKDVNAANEICYALQNGPDILVCDEAHMIKNRRADITQALKQVKTQRRIALTGSPLQNNLMEYYCMVDFVREGYLGSSHEFRNRFQNPIENGQHKNSTADDVKIMNQRSHILYEQLKGFVQRMDMNTVKKDLPSKTVYVITVKLSELQKKLYRRFLDEHGFTSNNGPSDKSFRGSSFFANYQKLAQVFNHPGLLQMAKEHRDNLRREDSIENFLSDDSTSDDNIGNDLLNSEKQKTRADLLAKKNESMFLSEESNWWKGLLDDKTYQEADYSGKMVLLLDILSMSSEVGDKALVFSQSLTTLDLIEFYLSKLPQKCKEGKFWKQGKDWYRLDGSTLCSERQNIVERFNDQMNTRVKCILISTRAGSLGINLHAANRVILVDGSWNPTHDLQAIYRAWRYGQNKPVYAYRLIAHRTMEEKIYKRQVTKEGLAARVMDRQQVLRTMSREEILHLFEVGDEEILDHSNENAVLVDPTITTGQAGREEGLIFRSDEIGCADKLMQTLLNRHSPSWIANYHEHESLLQENEAERLTKEEQEMAWVTYQKSLEWEEVHRTALKEPVADGISTDNGATQQPKAAAPRQSKPIALHQPKVASKSQQVYNQRKCTNLAHLLTLRSLGTKAGCITTCGDCGQEISWETLNRDGKLR